MSLLRSPNSHALAVVISYESFFSRSSIGVTSVAAMLLRVLYIRPLPHQANKTTKMTIPPTRNSDSGKTFMKYGSRTGYRTVSYFASRAIWLRVYRLISTSTLSGFSIRDLSCV